VRDGIRSGIQDSGTDIKVVAEASDGLEVLKATTKHMIDVFVLDITMPRLNGLDTARELIKMRGSTKIILLTIHNSRAMVEEAMDIGVRGYVTKESAGSKLVESIGEVHAGRFYLSSDIAHIIVNAAVSRSQKINRAPKVALTSQERKILQLIAEGYTAKEIAAEMELSLNTVFTHRKNLMSKLEIHKGTGLVRFALREGLAKL
jgi:DNA-binding NarL/FixJ family response regulator